MTDRYATKEEVKTAMKSIIKQYGNSLKVLAKYDEVGDLNEARRLVELENTSKPITKAEVKRTTKIAIKKYKNILDASAGNTKPKKKNTPYEDLLLDQLAEKGIVSPKREYKFLEDRRFRFDMAWPQFKLGVEVDGNVWHGGRHTSGAGFTKDAEKFALAAIDGWSIIRVTTGQVKNGQAIGWISAWFDKREFIGYS